MGTIKEVIPLELNKEPIPLLTPFKLGSFQLSHRMVLAPLTRGRSYGAIPQSHALTYYSQRASPGGFMLTEAVVCMDTGHGYPNTPGIYSKEQVEAWKPIVKAVHDKGAIFFCQLWHVGRKSHYEYQPNKAAPVSGTSIAIRKEQLFLPNYTLADYPAPRPLATEEIPNMVEGYRLAARNAMEAGFDGVEIHGGYGYLLEQFMKDQVNDRTDKYGNQNYENRCRFVMEIVDAVAEEVGPDRVGIRFTPFTDYGDVHDSDPTALGLYLAKELDKRDPHILYLHFVEPRVTLYGDENIESEYSLLPFRKAYSGNFIAAGGYTRTSGNLAISSGTSDLITFGRMFLSNPDLPRRFELNAPLNRPDRSTFYVPEPVVGYTDYPFLTEAQIEASLKAQAAEA